MQHGGSSRRLGSWSIATLGIVSACAPALPSVAGAPGVSSTPAVLWPVPEGARTPAPPPPPPQSPAATAALASDAPAAGASMELSLPAVVDLALRNDPATRESWALARSAAASYGAARGALFPTLNVQAELARSGGSTLGVAGSGAADSLGGTSRGTTTASARTQLAPTASLSYLLFDFGGRAGTIGAARERAVAANLTHNATVLNVVLQAETTLFTYLAARALRDAQIVTVSEAQADLTAATERQRLGVATLEEVLQTRTALSQARFELATDEGNLFGARGNLAVALGLPANARFDVPPIAASDSVADVLASVDTLINRAIVQRPELAESRAEAAALASEVRVARSAYLPSLALRSSTGLTRTLAPTNGTTRPYSFGLGLSIPIFSGFGAQYDALAAREQYAAGLARVASTHQQITVQVFTSYYQLRASTERVRSAADLLASAEQSATVALARYREGVGTIVDVLLARSALATARAEAIQARWEWRIGLAQLAHDAGVLDLRGRPNLPLGTDSSGSRR